MAGRKDFLRHIVNRVLASSNLPRQVVDDIRKFVGRAEDKYKFNAFGGDVRKLADYLNSKDFDDLVTLVKGVKTEKGEEPAVEVLKKILMEAREAYKDIPEVVEAVDRRLRELEGEAAPSKDRLEMLYRSLKDLEREGVKLRLDKEKHSVEITYGDKLRAIVKFSKKADAETYVLEYSIKDEEVLDNISSVVDRVKALLRMVKS